MKQFITMKILSCLLMLLVVSSMPCVAQKTSTAGKGCPKDTTDWDGFEIKENNVARYVTCIEALKKDYEDNKQRVGMSMLEMHTSLLNGYAKLDSYFSDDNTGDDEDEAKKYADIRLLMEKKTPPIEKNRSKKPKAEENDEDDDGGS